MFTGTSSACNHIPTLLLVCCSLQSPLCSSSLPVECTLRRLLMLTGISLMQTRRFGHLTCTSTSGSHLYGRNFRLTPFHYFFLGHNHHLKPEIGPHLDLHPLTAVFPYPYHPSPLRPTLVREERERSAAMKTWLGWLRFQMPWNKPPVVQPSAVAQVRTASSSTRGRGIGSVLSTPSSSRRSSPMTRASRRGTPALQSAA